jgi:Fe-Mn family superoxide dismutase
MKKVSRREAMTRVVAGGAGLALLNLTGVESAGAEQGNVAQGQTPAAAVPQAALAFRGQHQPKPLPFDPTKLKGLTEKLIRAII